MGLVAEWYVAVAVSARDEIRKTPTTKGLECVSVTRRRAMTDGTYRPAISIGNDFRESAWEQSISSPTSTGRSLNYG